MILLYNGLILREGASFLSLDIVRLEDSSKYCWKLERSLGIGVCQMIICFIPFAVIAIFAV